MELMNLSFIIVLLFVEDEKKKIIGYFKQKYKILKLYVRIQFVRKNLIFSVFYRLRIILI